MHLIKAILNFSINKNIKTKKMLKISKQIGLITAIILIYSAKLLAQDTIIVDQVIAVVGNKIILESEVEAQYMQYKARNNKADYHIKCDIFEESLKQKLFINQAIIDSIEVSQSEVEYEIANRLDNFIEQLGGIEKVEEYFGKPLAQIKEDLKEITKDQLTANKMQMTIGQDIKVTPAEVNKFYQNLPKDSLPLIDTEIEIQQILIYPKSTPEQVKEVKDKLLSFKKQIEKGERKFETLAILYSDDPGTASNGGEMGYMARGELVPEFASAAFKLDKNEISNIVKTDFGYHIIQLVDRKGERVKVRHILMKPKISTTSKIAARNRLDSITKLIKNDSISFAIAATYFNEDERTRNNEGLMINPYTGTSKFTTDKIHPALKYVIKDLEPGEISKPFESYDQSGKNVYMIIRLKSKTEPHLASLDTDYQKIQNMALMNKNQKLIDEWIQEKQKTMYITMDKKYKKCNFKYKGWLK